MLVKTFFIRQLSESSISDLEQKYDGDSPKVFEFVGLSLDFTYTQISHKKYGIGPYFLKTWRKHLETLYDINIKEMTDFQRYISYYFLLYLLPKDLDPQKRILFNISRWYYLYCYRGWRHFYNLPVKGQRTWSNNKTRFPW